VAVSAGADTIPSPIADIVGFSAAAVMVMQDATMIPHAKASLFI
jgi:hypothetical protein